MTHRLTAQELSDAIDGAVQRGTIDRLREQGHSVISSSHGIAWTVTDDGHWVTIAGITTGPLTFHDARIATEAVWRAVHNRSMPRP
jgi:hypothetical protein